MRIIIDLESIFIIIHHYKGKSQCVHDMHYLVDKWVKSPTKKVASSSNSIRRDDVLCLFIYEEEISQYLHSIEDKIWINQILSIYKLIIFGTVCRMVNDSFSRYRPGFNILSSVVCKWCVHHLCFFLFPLWQRWSWFYNTTDTEV